MANDFRLTVDFEDESHLVHLGRLLEEHELEETVHAQLGSRVLVTHSGPRVFLYTGTLEQARAAEAVLRAVLSKHALEATVGPLMRWHPVEKRWDDASLPLPDTPDEVAAEHERWEEEEDREAEELGYDEWEVRVELPSHRDAVDLARRLDAEGIRPIVRRWKYLLIGTADEDQARALAERLREEAPNATDVEAEPSWTIAWEATAKNPFAPFGAFGPGPT